MSFWDKIQQGAKKAGESAGVAAQKAKLRTDMMMLDRDIQNRKKAFGVSMYDHVAPLSQSQDFYAATDELTTLVRPHLINAQKEIQALAAKRVKLKEALAQAEAKRAGAFPTQAEGVGGKLLNFGKASAMHSHETKIKAELAIVDRQIKTHKQNFGLELFADFEQAEDTRGWLPSDRAVRNLYDSTRGDIQKLENDKKRKETEIHQLGGSTNAADHSTTPSVTVQSSSGGFSDTPQQSSSTSANTYGSNNNTYSAPYSDSNNNSGPEDLLLKSEQQCFV